MIKKTFLMFCVGTALLLGIVNKVQAEDMEVTMPDGTTAFVIKDGSGKNVLRAQSDGNVGIGTTNPRSPLEIGGLGNSGSGSLRILSNNAAEGNSARIESSHNLHLQSDQTRVTFQGSDGIADMVVRIDTGNVGIGNANPTEKLEVTGTIKATAFVGDGSGLTGVPSGSGNAAGAACFVSSWFTSPQTSCTGTILASGSMNNNDNAAFAASQCEKWINDNQRRDGGCCMFHLFGEGEWFVTNGTRQNIGNDNCNGNTCRAGGECFNNPYQ